MRSNRFRRKRSCADAIADRFDLISLAVGTERTLDGLDGFGIVVQEQDRRGDRRLSAFGQADEFQAAGDLNDFVQGRAGLVGDAGQVREPSSKAWIFSSFGDKPARS